MRVGVQTWGTEGDIRPMFSLAAALRAKGHDVRLVYTNVESRDFGPLAARCGIDATSVGDAYFRDHREELAVRARASFDLGSPLKQVRQIVEDLMDPIADEMFEAGDALARESDVMIAHFLAHPAHTACDKHGKPLVIVALAPVFPSAHYAPIGMPSLGRFLNPLSWKVVSWVMESIFRDRVNGLRARAGLGPIRGLHEKTLTDTLLSLVAVSPTLFPRPPDWHARAALCGFLGLPDAAEPWEPDDDLRTFLADGPPPAFLSFGSMFNLDHDRTMGVVATLAKAVAAAGTRGIIQAPETVIRDAPRSDAVHYILRAPHAQLFPRCSMVVHHGGAGTTQSALLAGRPSIVVPHAADQFYWGDLLYRRGVASKSLRSTRLTDDALAARIRWVLDRPDLAVRARSLGAALALERGPECAAELIEQAMRDGPARR